MPRTRPTSLRPAWCTAATTIAASRGPTSHWWPTGSGGPRPARSRPPPRPASPRRCSMAEPAGEVLDVLARAVQLTFEQLQAGARLDESHAGMGTSGHGAAHRRRPGRARPRRRLPLLPAPRRRAQPSSPASTPSCRRSSTRSITREGAAHPQERRDAGARRRAAPAMPTWCCSTCAMATGGVLGQGSPTWSQTASSRSAWSTQTPRGGGEQPRRRRAGRGRQRQRHLPGLRRRRRPCAWCPTAGRSADRATVAGGRLSSGARHPGRARLAS